MNFRKSIFNSDVKSTVKNDFVYSLKSGLTKQSASTCSKWAEKYRVINKKPWVFDRFPWLRDMHDSLAETNIGQKSAQMGYTETVLNICFYHIDIHQRSILYVLPSRTPDAGDFSAGRFNPAVEDSEHLTKLFSDVKNVGHKRAGSANLYIRGGRSRGSLKSIPVSGVILDEVNEMLKENIPLAFERTSGQDFKFNWLISTPTLEDSGISLYYNNSSQNHFYFRCPSCSRYVEFKYPESLVIIGDSVTDPRLSESYLRCTECKNKILHEEKVTIFKNSRWVESYTDRDMKGWHISQLYSTTVDPPAIAKSYFYSLTDPSMEQEFFNSKLGLTHEVEGARVTEEQIIRVIRDYKKFKENQYSAITTMGVDVGYPYINFEIDEWTLPRFGHEDLNILSKPRVINYGKLHRMEDLDELMSAFQVRFCIIDAHPERRKALEFANRFWGHVRLAFYGNGITGKNIHINKDEPTLTIDRTSWLDLSLGRFRNGTIALPSDVDTEYKENIKALVRTYEKDSNGNSVATYENTKPDHYAHARNYAEIALPLAVSMAENQPIETGIV